MFLGEKEGFSRPYRELCLFFPCLIVLPIPPERMLRLLGEVLPKEVVQSEGRAPVDLLISTVSINRNELLVI